MGPATPTIRVDHRERPSGIAPLLAARAGIAVREARLAAGDYAIGPHIGVERKTAADLARSIADNRLFPQMHRLRASYDVAILVTQARPAARREPGVHPNAVRGALASVAGRFGVAVLPARGRRDAARFLAFLAAQAGRAAPAAPTRPGSRVRSLERQRLRVLEGLPAVGPVLARRLLARFGSVEACLCADEAELARVEGVGRVRARAIRRVVGG